MAVRGRVQNGVVVLADGVRLPEGTAVTVVPESVTEQPTPEGEGRILEEEHRRVLEIIDRIAALPIEGPKEPFSGADHDKILYGKP
ncbi:MAG TPA: hypothetical protein VGQ81_12730 [Acidobacteriota bacterium]|jgi:hypothetical protein|nr:hypothetical protein [Acidobacteriota bacterium]